MAAWAVAAVFGIVSPAFAAPPAQRWQRNPQDPRWVQGQIELPTPAPEIWNRLAEVRGWPSLFSDIASFSVRFESADRSHWVVRFESKTVGHGAHDYTVALDPVRRSGRIVVHAPGVVAAAYVSVRPIADGRSRVSYSIYVDRSGLIGLLLSESWLRAYQERLVERDLGDLERAFRARHAEEGIRADR